MKHVLKAAWELLFTAAAWFALVGAVYGAMWAVGFRPDPEPSAAQAKGKR